MVGDFIKSNLTAAGGMFKRLIETYYWLWHDVFGMANPFTFYFRQLASRKPAAFWLPVACITAALAMILVCLAALFFAAVRPAFYSARPLWQKLLLVMAWAIAEAAALGGFLFMAWFILHILAVHPFGG